MKNYIFSRIQQAERTINDELNFCLKYKRAKDIVYKDIMERVMLPMKIKSMPVKYKDQISSILWFCWKREISSKFVFPVLFQGKLYSEWDAMPEECQKMIMEASSGDLKHRPYPVFNFHFTEGMDAE